MKDKKMKDIKWNIENDRWSSKKVTFIFEECLSLLKEKMEETMKLFQKETSNVRSSIHICIITGTVNTTITITIAT
jgi:hypothetical protein